MNSEKKLLHEMQTEYMKKTLQQWNTWKKMCLYDVDRRKVSRSGSLYRDEFYSVFKYFSEQVRLAGLKMFVYKHDHFISTTIGSALPSQPACEYLYENFLSC